jgi:ribosomal protein L44E
LRALLPWYAFVPGLNDAISREKLCRTTSSSTAAVHITKSSAEHTHRNLYKPTIGVKNLFSRGEFKMKIPKTRTRYCPKCKKHTEQKVSQNRSKTPFTSHPLAAGNMKLRAKWRGRIGMGNNGKYSRPPVNKRKMSGKKTSKKTDFRFECGSCKKIHVQASTGIRARKIEFV